MPDYEQRSGLAYTHTNENISENKTTLTVFISFFLVKMESSLETPHGNLFPLNKLLFKSLLEVKIGKQTSDITNY